MSANGLTRLPYSGDIPDLREQLDHISGPAEWISPCCLPPLTNRWLSGRRMGYSFPRWSLLDRLMGIIHEAGGLSREGWIA